MKLEKASIDVYERGTIKSQIKVLFNPFEYSIERGNAWKSTAVPGLSGPLLQFVNGEAEVLTLELFLDDYTDGSRIGTSVHDRIIEVANLLETNKSLHA